MKFFIFNFLFLYTILVSAQYLIKESEAFPTNITSVAINLNADKIIAGSYDKFIYCVNPQTGQTDDAIEEHKGFVLATAYNISQNVFATAGWDKKIIIWDAINMDKKMEIEAHKDRINSMVFSPDGLRLASASDDGTIIVWDLMTGGEIFKITDHNDAVTCIAYSKDGTMIASGGWSNKAMIHSSSSGELLWVYEGHRNTVNTVDFSYDGSMIVTGGEDNLCMVWKTDTSEMLMKFDYFRKPVSKALFLPEDKYLFCAEASGDLKVFNLHSKSLLEQNQLHDGALTDMVINIDKDIMVTTGTDNKIKIWNIGEFKYFDCLSRKIAARKDLTKPKGEFETTVQYENRLKKYNIIKKGFIAECFREAQARQKAEQDRIDKIILSSYMYVYYKLDGLGVYDADTQIYPIIFQGKNYMLKIALEDAKALKINVQKAKVKAIKRVINGNTEIFNRQLIHPVNAKSYPIGPQVKPIDDKFLQQFLSTQ